MLEVLGSNVSRNTLAWSALIGFAGGISTFLFREANICLKLLLTGQSIDIVSIAKNLSPEMRILIPTLGGFLAGFVLFLSAKLFKETRSQEYLEVIRLGDGVISIRPTLMKLLSSLLSISSGASVGREGGMVQMSALFASSIGRFFNFSNPKLKLMVACGCSAGLASAYNTPLSGAVFIAEIVMQSISIEVLGPLIVSAVVATITIRHWIGMSPIFTLPLINASIHVEILPILGLGLVCGLLSPVFLVFLESIKKIFKKLSLPLPISLALGGLAVGIISLDMPDVWGNGHAVIEGLLNQNETVSFVWQLLILKLLATLIVVGSGTVGGVFTPTLVFGSTVGWLYSYHLHALFPTIQTENVVYAVLGMGAFLAGTTHAPLMAVLMVFEMTLDGNLLFPLILVVMFARYLSVVIRPTSIYGQTSNNTNKSPHYLIQVSDIKTSASSVVDMNVSAERVSQLFCLSSIESIWVVDEKGIYKGVILLQDMKQFLGDAELKHLKAAWVFMENKIPTIQEEAPLTDALILFTQTKAERLPVVSKDMKLIGELTKTDVLLSLY